MTDEFGKKVDFLRKEMFQYNSEIGAIIDIVKQDQDAALKKINKTVSEILKVNQTMADEHTKVKIQQQTTMTTVTLHDSTITSLIDQATQLEAIISNQLARAKPNALSSPLNTDRTIFQQQQSVDSCYSSNFVQNMPVSGLERDRILLVRATDQLRRCQVALFRNRSPRNSKKAQPDDILTNHRVESPIELTSSQRQESKQNMSLQEPSFADVDVLLTDLNLSRKRNTSR